MSTPGMPVQARRVAQQLTVLEERGVGPVVSDEASEAQPEARVVVALVVRVAGVAWRRACPPTCTSRPPLVRAPPASGSCSIRAYASGEVAVASRGRHDLAERLRHSAGKIATHRSGHPLDLASVVVTTLTRIISVTRSGCASRVGEAECRSPRPSPHEPSVDAEVLAGVARCHRRDVRSCSSRGRRPAQQRAACSCRSRVDRTARPDSDRGRTSGESEATHR